MGVSRVRLASVVRRVQQVCPFVVSVVSLVHVVVSATPVHKVQSALPVSVIHLNVIQNSQLTPRDQARRAPMKMTTSQRSKLVSLLGSLTQLTLLTLMKRTSHTPMNSTITPHLPMMSQFFV